MAAQRRRESGPVQKNAAHGSYSLCGRNPHEKVRVILASGANRERAVMDDHHANHATRRASPAAMRVVGALRGERAGDA